MASFAVPVIYSSLLLPIMSSHFSLNLVCTFICQGENPKKPGAPHNVRLYSIASTRYGDKFDGRTASLCVRRAVYYDPETGKEDPSKNGICSNFLCNSKPGDKIQLTGSFQIDTVLREPPNFNRTFGYVIPEIHVC